MVKFYSGFKLILFLLFSIFFFPWNTQGKNGSLIKVSNLRCDYLTNPLGIDDTRPCFSWELESERGRERQEAYQIMVASDSIHLKNNIGDVWLSGKVINGKTNQIRYNGVRLHSGRVYYWKVRAWDNLGKVSKWSSPQFWSMGLLYKKDWKAKWIGLKSIDSITNQDKYIVPPSPLLRKEFKVNERIYRAVLFMSVLGSYRIYINGKRIGDHILAPEWTDYAKRVQYQTYDVTKDIETGENVIGATLADGWYAGGLWSHFFRGRYGFNRRLLTQLQIEYADGSSDTIVSDGSWKILKKGPIKEASIYDGEVYDERDIPEGWEFPGFNDSCWTDAFIDTTVHITLNAQMNPPIKIVKKITPISVFKLEKNKYDRDNYIIDMGQNIAGWIRLNLPYNPGRKLIFKYAEMLNHDSSLYTANLRNARPVDEFIPGIESKIVYEPEFTYHGFRYVEISGLPEPPKLNQITGMVMASSSSIVSNLETSDKEVNKLYQNILWTQLDNMPGIPTDCPQRDERMGWMGDAQIFSQTAIFNMDMDAFYRKWLRDIRDEQTSDGQFPNYAPYVTESLRYYDAPGWADAGVIIPWKVYLNYGDTQILKDNFESMCKFIDNILKNNPDLIRTNEVGQDYGDWLNGNTIKEQGYPTTGGSVPKDLFNTAYFAYSTMLLAKGCKILGKKNLFKHYDSLSLEIRTAFDKRFINSNGIITGNTQAGYAISLEFNLVPPKLKASVVKNMVNAVKAYDYRISTGIHTTRMLLNQLSDNGYNDIAYQLIESHQLPSWFYSIDQGATTIWERWDGYVKGRGFQDPNMNSFNQPVFGAVGEWMFENILGIRPDEKHPGYHHFFIKPAIGGKLKWVRGSYHSVVGKIGVSWKRSNDRFTYEIDIPVNSTATVILPTEKKITEEGNEVNNVNGVKLISKKDGQTSLLVQSGKYIFKY